MKQKKRNKYLVYIKMRIRQGPLSQKAILKTNVLNQEVPLNRPDLFIRTGNKLFRPKNVYDYVKCLKNADEYQQQAILLAYQERANKSVSLHVVPYKNNFRPPHQIANLSAKGSTPLTVKVKKLSTETQTTPSLNNTETQTTQLITGEQGIQTENSGEPSSVPVQTQVAPEVATQVAPETPLPLEQTIPETPETLPTKQGQAGPSKIPPESIEDYDTPDYDSNDDYYQSDPEAINSDYYEEWGGDDDPDTIANEIVTQTDIYFHYNIKEGRQLFQNFKNAILASPSLSRQERQELIELFPSSLKSLEYRAKVINKVLKKAAQINKFNIINDILKNAMINSQLRLQGYSPYEIKAKRTSIQSFTQESPEL